MENGQSKHSSNTPISDENVMSSNLHLHTHVVLKKKTQNGKWKQL